MLLWVLLTKFTTAQKWSFPLQIASFFVQCYMFRLSTKSYHYIPPYSADKKDLGLWKLHTSMTNSIKLIHPNYETAIKIWSKHQLLLSSSSCNTSENVIKISTWSTLVLVGPKLDWKWIPSIHTLSFCSMSVQMICLVPISMIFIPASN